MKLQKLVKYVDMMSMILIVIILILIFFGCFRFKWVEKFENELTDYQKQIIDGVKGGNIDSKLITSYIQEDKLKMEDLDKIIQHLS
jgi:hypothetical protein